MDHQLAFHDVIPRTHKYLRKRDLGSFEHTYKAEITSVYRLTQQENLYRVRIIDDEDRRHFTFQPGQFIMLELPGIGEGPFGISSSPSNHEDIELCIRTVGTLTGVLSRAPRGTRVGLRGPFGTSFPMARMHHGNVLLIAGGLGLAPLRSPIAYVQEHRSQFDQVDIIYGTKEPSQLLFKYQYEMWKKDDLGLHVIVERPDPSWTGDVGLITKVVDELIARSSPQFIERTHAVVCGPPVMFKFVCDLLSKKGLPMHKMFVSLERRMHCGMGKCCRC